MTRVTTITEYEQEGGKTVTASSCDGFYGQLVFANDEAKMTFFDSDGEPDEQFIHPDDAMVEFLAKFFEI